MLALVVMAALWLVACTGAVPAGQPAAGTAEVGAPAAEAPAGDVEVTRENTLIYAGELSDLLTLDPAVVYEFSGIAVVGNVYETLVSFEPGQPGIKPLLAESWEIVDSGDMWTLTFALNPNATFASGNPVTAEDVVYSWGRAIDINKSPAFLLIDIAQLTKENMTAVDDQTLEVKLPKTVSPQVFLSVISFSTAAVVEKAVVEANLGADMGETWLNDHSAGSGPYVLSAWERSVQVTLDANANYWGDAPAMQRIIMQNVGELANLQALIETGDADIVQDLGPEQAAAMEGNPDLQLVKADSTLLVYVGLNVLKPPLDNVDVREAIRYAINYDDINTLLAGNGRVVQEIIPAGFLGHTGETYFTQDLEMSRSLLEQAGVAEGTEIGLLIPVGPAPGGLEWGVIASKIQSDLAQVGLVVNIQQTQQSELLNIYRAQDGEMVLINWGPDFPDPDGNVTPFTNYEAQSIAWRNGWDDPDIAELGKQAALEQDTDARTQLYAQLEERVAHEGPYVMLYQPSRTYGVRNNVTGFLYDPADTPSITFANISKE
ncbi:MAG: ABC transporter substrate-binding protein [Caldilineaceae bacterium]|nr:ABC transporter substrate-binding protein [Caldilineaceae bacterium]